MCSPQRMPLPPRVALGHLFGYASGNIAAIGHITLFICLPGRCRLVVGRLFGCDCSYLAVDNLQPTSDRDHDHTIIRLPCLLLRRFALVWLFELSLSSIGSIAGKPRCFARAKIAWDRIAGRGLFDPGGQGRNVRVLLAVGWWGMEGDFLDCSNLLASPPREVRLREVRLLRLLRPLTDLAHFSLPPTPICSTPICSNPDSDVLYSHLLYSYLLYSHLL